jgi:hypothetical protein
MFTPNGWPPERVLPYPAEYARHEHAGKIEAQLKAEVTELLAKAEAADHADVPDGMSIPGELARREARLAKLAEAHWLSVSLQFRPHRRIPPRFSRWRTG